MTAKAYVLIETAVGKSKDVVADVTQLDGVESVDSVTGPYDVIAIIEAETMIGIGDLVVEKIGGISGITRTVTCLAVKPS
jgi:DNA-binding Lrp family transcriptional regulator